MDASPRAGRSPQTPPGADADVRWTPVRIFTVALCALVGGIDSFDTQMIGFTGPLIAHDFGFPVAWLGWIFAANQLGGIVGAFLFGYLADRFGRLRMLVVTCLLAALFTAATLATKSFALVVLFRVLAGLGLGGAMPCFLGLGTDAMPPRLRLAMTSALFASFPAGGLIGAWASAPLLAIAGWRAVFAAGASALVLVALLLMIVPVTRALPSTPGGRARVASMFSDGRFRVTLPLWALFLLAPAGIYLLALWVPSILQLLGLTAAHTGVLVGFVNLGALVMDVAGGLAMVRYGRIRVVLPMLLVGALSFTIVALLYRQPLPLAVAMTVAGAALGGVMALLVSIAANAFPAELRATAIGWSLGFSKAGQMISPVGIGAILAAGAAPRLALTLCGLPSLLALVPLILLDRAIARAARRDKAVESAA